MISHIRTAHWLLVGGWLLLTPPTPLRTSLPPLSDWSKVSTHKSAGECEQAREKMRSAARRTAAADPNAPALKVAAALGQLQSRCVEAAAAPRDEAATPPVASQPATAEPEPVSDEAAPGR